MKNKGSIYALAPKRRQTRILSDMETKRRPNRIKTHTHTHRNEKKKNKTHTFWWLWRFLLPTFSNIVAHTKWTHGQHFLYDYYILFYVLRSSSLHRCARAAPIAIIHKFLRHFIFSPETMYIQLLFKDEKRAKRNEMSEVRKSEKMR